MSHRRESGEVFRPVASGPSASGWDRTVPASFAGVDPAVLGQAAAHAKLVVRDVLADDTTAPALADYYDPDGAYAGATFVWVQPIDPNSITAADLFSLTLLSVDAPAPDVARALLGFRQGFDAVIELLRSPYLKEPVELEFADAATLEAMAALYGQVKSTLGVDPWVTASKLCARKRPSLFPVRDRLVRDLLDLTRHRNYQLDWLVFRALMQDDDIREHLYARRDEAAAKNTTTVTDAHPLRWLDVALWMHAKSRRRND